MINLALQLWQQSEPREKIFMSVGAVFCIIVFAYALIWAPLQRHMQSLRVDNNNKVELVQWMHTSVPELMRLRRTRPTKKPVTGPKLSIVESTLKNSQLASYQPKLSLASGDKVSVSFAKAPFNGIVFWLSMLSKQQGMTVESITMDALGTDAPGMVRTNLILASA